MASTLLVDNIEDLSVETSPSSVVGNYTYIGYADTSAGGGFTTTFSSGKLYYAIITSETEIVSLTAANFTGLWLPIPGKDIARNHFTYIGFADDTLGNGYTSTFSLSKKYYAIRWSQTALSVSASSFTGLWRPMEKFPEVASYENVSYLSTTYSYYNSLAMASNIGPHTYYYNDRIYFAIFDGYENAGYTGATNHRTHTDGVYVGYYDLLTNSFSALTSITMTYEYGDLHNMPALIVADDGSIIVAKETLNATGGTPPPVGHDEATHNSQIEIWRSDSPEDISTFSLMSTLTNTDYTGDLQHGFSYPNLLKGTLDGYLYLFMRGFKKVGTGHDEILMVYSDDNGLTWQGLDETLNTPGVIVSCANFNGDTADWFLYLESGEGHRKHGLTLLLIPNEGDDDNTGPDGTHRASRYKTLCYLHSDDGITWENVHSQFSEAGSFSKDVSVAAITSSELYSNFIVASVYGVANVSYVDFSLSSDGNGVPHLVYSTMYRRHSDVTPDYLGRDDLRIGDFITYYSTSIGDWVTNEITGFNKNPAEVTSGDEARYSANCGRVNFMIYEDGTIDLITFRTKVKTDWYKAAYTPLQSGALEGGIFKIITTQANNFGDGVVANDWAIHTYGKTINASNTVIPIERETCFFRTYDKGVTYHEIRPSLETWGTEYATSSPLLTNIFNYQESGYFGTFVGYARPLAAGTAYDHADLVLVYSKVTPSDYNPV